MRSGTYPRGSISLQPRSSQAYVCSTRRCAPSMPYPPTLRTRRLRIDTSYTSITSSHHPPPGCLSTHLIIQHLSNTFIGYAAPTACFNELRPKRGTCYQIHRRTDLRAAAAQPALRAVPAGVPEDHGAVIGTIPAKHVDRSKHLP